VPLARRIAAGAAIPGSPDAYLNLLHVDDAASAVLAAADHDSTSGEIFLVSDGHPITRREYVEALAARQGIVAPPLDGTGGLGKRVRNTRALRELGLRVSAAIDAIGRD
jgi:nucleoside-diphosphate-sugar epimerase